MGAAASEDRTVADVCVIVVSHNGRRWLDAALETLFEHAGDATLDVVLVDNGSDGSADHVEQRFPGVRALRCENRGFGHANNRGLETADARYVLFLNPDTEVLEGTVGGLVAELDASPAIGLAGGRQLRSDDSLAPSIRRFPAVRHMVAEALGVERMPGFRRFLGERDLVEAHYERRTPCDWTSGSFMLARTAAVEGSGGFDERFFLFSEETDLCWRLKHDGWQVAHLPGMTIRHYEHDESTDPRLEAQAAHSRILFARKHLGRLAGCYRWALALRYGLRVLFQALRGHPRSHRALAARAALRTVVDGRPPFGLADGSDATPHAFLEGK